MKQQPQSFVRKSYDLTAMCYLGTRESAIDLIDWVKRDPNANYRSAEFREDVSNGNFGDIPDSKIHVYNSLTIHTDSSRLNLRPGDWLIYFDEDGIYSTTTNQRFIEKYADRYPVDTTTE